MHALFAGAAVDVRVEDGWSDAVCAFHAVVGENWVWFRAGNAGFAIKVRRCKWARLGFGKLRSGVELFDDL